MTAYPNRTNGMYRINCDSCGGGLMPSTTTFIGDTLNKEKINQWREKRAALLQYKYNPIKSDTPTLEEESKLMDLIQYEKQKIFNRGSEKHSYIEAYFKSGTLITPLEVDGYYQAFKSFLEDYEFIPEYVEEELHCCCHKIAGTSDIGGRLRKRNQEHSLMVVGDWKTQEVKEKYKDKKPTIWPDIIDQLCSYGHMALSQKKLPKLDAVVGVAFGSNGKYNVKEFPYTFEYVIMIHQLWARRNGKVLSYKLPKLEQ